MSKYSYEQKLESVLNIIELHMSLQESAKLLGAGKESVRGWVKRYEEFGTKGLLMKSGTYDGQFKIHLIEYMHTNHFSVAETAVKFGIPSHSVVLRWERIYYEEGREALLIDNCGRKKMIKENKSGKLKLDKKLKKI